MTLDPQGTAAERSALPALLEAVLSVGSELELRTTLQHIVESAAALCGARYGALGVVDPRHAPVNELFTARLDQGGTAAKPPRPP
ncbi:histidine kinase, partial [Streptomyces sp. NPDC059999]